jgi:hypothetical protein
VVTPCGRCVLLYGTEGEVYSTDGGETWNRSSYENLPAGYMMTLFTGACATGQFCVLTGGKDPNGLGLPTPILLTTHNGGASWSVLEVPTPTPAP